MQIFVCDEMMIPFQSVSIIKRDKNDYTVGRWNPDGKYCHWDPLSQEGFDQMKENILQQKKHEKKIKKLEQKIKELELHISLSPGGFEYLQAQKDFTQSLNEQVNL